MKIGELVKDQEYAFHNYQRVPSERDVRGVSHVRFVGFESIEGPKTWSPTQGMYIATKRRQVKLELVEPATIAGTDREPGFIIRIDTNLKRIWYTWEEYQQRLAQVRAIDERRKAVRDQVLAALGVLGLHGARYIRSSEELVQAEVMLGGAEIVKLATRAEHLVELERMVYDWWGDDSRISSDSLELDVWASHHDFSMLRDDALAQQYNALPGPTAETIAELAAGPDA